MFGVVQQHQLLCRNISQRDLWCLSVSSSVRGSRNVKVWRGTTKTRKHICYFFFLLLSLWVKPFSPVWNVPIIWATGSMNLLRTNKLVLYDFMFVLSSYTFLEMGQGNKTGKTKNSDSLKTIKDREVCAKASGEPWACWTQNIHSPVPWLHKVLLLDNTQNISTDVLYIPRNACYLFVSIYYLFIYLVCGFECIFMHTYYILCFWASCEGCIVTQS